MTVKAEKELGPLLHKETSPTAASAWDRKYPTSGVQPHRVYVDGVGPVIVDATTGDEAAEKALVLHPGRKIGSIAPVSTAA